MIVPREASTLILLRRRDALEVLVLRRHHRSAFMPGAYVFPGGAVELSDYESRVEDLCEGLGFADAHRIIRGVTPPEMSLGFFVAAIREAFEEAGILLAYDHLEEELVATDLSKAETAQLRQFIQANPRAFPRMIRDGKMKLATDRLFYFAHWITPETSPIRFDARFFLAKAPDHQEVLHDSFETTDAMWRCPFELLRDHNEGRLYLPVPTLSCVRELTAYSTVEEAIGASNRKNIPLSYG